MLRYFMWVINVVASLGILLMHGTLDPPNDLFWQLRESMVEGQFVQPEFRGLPAEAGEYRGFFVRHPVKVGANTYRMRGGAAFTNGCVGAESVWTIHDRRTIEMTEFQVFSFHPNIRCH